MIYVDEYGNPWAMHHAITADRDFTKYTSWGVPFWRILEKFGEYFGVDALTSSHQEMSTWQCTCASPQGDAVPPPRIAQSFAPGEEPKSLEEEFVVVHQPKLRVPSYIVED